MTWLGLGVGLGRFVTYGLDEGEAPEAGHRRTVHATVLSRRVRRGEVEAA